MLSHPTMLTEQWGYFLHALGMAMRGQPWREKIGICLYDLNERDTGKSAFTECLQLALGDYAGPVDAGVLRKAPKRSKNAHSTEKVALVGLRIGWIEESDEIVIDTPEWRNLIGNRTFTARELHQPMTTYVNTCMVILLGNGIPRIDLSSTPAYRRYRPLKAEPIPPRRQTTDLRNSFSKGDYIHDYPSKTKRGLR